MHRRQTLIEAAKNNISLPLPSSCKNLIAGLDWAGNRRDINCEKIINITGLKKNDFTDIKSALKYELTLKKVL